MVKFSWYLFCFPSITYLKSKANRWCRSTAWLRGSLKKPKFRKLTVLYTEDVRLCSFYPFNGVIFQAPGIFESLPEIFTAQVGAEPTAARIAINNSGKPGAKKYSKGGSIIRNSARDLELLFPIKAINMTQSCREIYNEMDCMWFFRRK